MISKNIFFKLEDYINCLYKARWYKANQVENKINRSEKNELNVESLQKIIKNSQKPIS